jgi:hypothetical protein
MGLQREHCTHGKALCQIYGGARQFAHKADNVLQDYGERGGQFIQAVAAPVALLNPAVGLTAGAIGKGIETYAQVRNEMGQ